MKDAAETSDFIARLDCVTREARAEFDRIWSMLLDDADAKARFQGFMVETYHYVRFTCPLLERFEREIRPDNPSLADYAAGHRKEEAGHDVWMLDDLERLGFDRARVSASRPLRETQALVGAQYYLMESGRALDHLGYIYALECDPPREIETLARRVDLPVEALSTYAAHGELDAGHGAELRAVIDDQVRRARDQAGVIANARETLEFMSELVLALTVEPAGELSGRLSALARTG
ncbi:iron-containing redox enzyme family protein [Marinicauda algicola]|nr:iron-containing redox enzyme family protein [Marinicauda algicola]